MSAKKTKVFHSRGDIGVSDDQMQPKTKIGKQETVDKTENISLDLGHDIFRVSDCEVRK